MVEPIVEVRYKWSFCPLSQVVVYKFAHRDRVHKYLQVLQHMGMDAGERKLALTAAMRGSVAMSRISSVAPAKD